MVSPKHEYPDEASGSSLCSRSASGDDQQQHTLAGAQVDSSAALECESNAFESPIIRSSNNHGSRANYNWSPVMFHKASESSGVGNNHSDTREKNRNNSAAPEDISISGLYRETVTGVSTLTPSPETPSSSNSPEICPDCGITILDHSTHLFSSVHLASSTKSVQQPLTKLPVDPDSFGYKYLEKYGWKHYKLHGLGQKGRKGSRHPIKVVPKLDRTGICEDEDGSLLPKGALSGSISGSGSGRTKPKNNTILTAKEAKIQDLRDKQKLQQIRRALS